MFAKGPGEVSDGLLMNLAVIERDPHMTSLAIPNHDPGGWYRATITELIKVIREQHAEGRPSMHTSDGDQEGRVQVGERPAEFEFAYFVVYAHDRGFGCTEFWRKTPIESFDDVKSIAEEIESNDGVGKVCILNWIRYPGIQSPPSTHTSDGSPRPTSAAETDQ
jgi:hypothetical protein